MQGGMYVWQALKHGKHGSVCNASKIQPAATHLGTGCQGCRSKNPLPGLILYTPASVAFECHVRWWWWKGVGTVTCTVVWQCMWLTSASGSRQTQEMTSEQARCRPPLMGIDAIQATCSARMEQAKKCSAEQPRSACCAVILCLID